MKNKERYVVIFLEYRQKLCTKVYHKVGSSVETKCGVFLINKDKMFSRRPSRLRVCKRCARCKS